MATRAVKELEDELGLRLLHRSTRRVVLTEEGQEVLERVDDLLASFQQLKAMALSRSVEIAGKIRLQAPVAFGTRRLGPVLASFVNLHPQVKFDLQLSDAAGDLIGGGADLALRIGTDLPPSFVARKVGEESVGIFGSPDYLRRRGEPQHPSKLERHECLGYSGTVVENEWNLTHGETGDRFDHRPGGGLNSNAGAALVAMTEQGLGLAQLPCYLVEEAVARGGLRPVLPAWSVPSLPIFLVYATREHQPRRVRQFIDHLAQALGFKNGPI